MKPPIIIVESESCIYVFETIDKAELYLEPIDVINDEYIGYDAEGCLLKLSVTGNKNTPMYDRKVVITAHEQKPNHVSDLRKVLAKFFSHLKLPKDWILQASLPELVAKVQEFKTE